MITLSVSNLPKAISMNILWVNYERIYLFVNLLQKRYNLKNK